MLNSKEKIRKFIKGKELLEQFGFKLNFLFLPVLFSVLATLFEGVNVAALIPFAKGIISKDFSFVTKIAYLNKPLQFFYYPEYSNTIIFFYLLLIVFISGILKNIFGYLGSIAISRQVRRATAGLRSIIFGRYLSFGKMFFDRNNIAQLQNILTHFSFAIGNEFSSLNVAAGQLCMLFLYIFLMFFISWKLTLFVILILPLFDLVFRKLIGKIKRNSELSAKISNNLVKSLFNVLSCITIVKIYSNEEKEKLKFQSSNLYLNNLEYGLDKKYNLIPFLQEIMFLVAILILVSGMSFLYVKGKEGDLASFMVYFYLLRRSQQAVGGFNRIKSTISRISGPINSIKNIFENKDKFFIPQGSIELKKFADKIEFKGLNFYYEPDKQILFDITFSIEKGKVVAVVGETGAGKTTLANLLLRFYDCPPGTIFIDNNDIRDFNTKSLLMNFAYVSQENFIFNDTIRNNIVYGLERIISEEELRNVLVKSRLDGLIDSLANGIDTYVGDRGVKLSGGEKQRISIARALLKGSEILILDEATSSLDSVTEKLIQEAIDEAIKGRTVLVIAHRLSTVKNADKIVVIEHGRVVEQGPLQRLLEDKGKFYSYWETQRFLK